MAIRFFDRLPGRPTMRLGREEALAIGREALADGSDPMVAEITRRDGRRVWILRTPTRECWTEVILDDETGKVIAFQDICLR